MANRRIHPYFVCAYVYALTVDGRVRYIGKGRRYRVVDHLSRIKAVAAGRQHTGTRNHPAYLKFAAAYNAGAEINYFIIANGLTDEEAYLLEYSQIEGYQAGELWNAQAGGRGDTGGRRLREVWDNPATRASLAEKIRIGHLNDRYKERARVKSLEKWQDSKFRTKWLAQHRAVWDDPKAAAERCAHLKAVWETKTEAKEKVRAAVTKAWTPERRATQSENRRRAWADPEFKRRVTAKVAQTKAEKTNA